jgi:hypothetical protein
VRRYDAVDPEQQERADHRDQNAADVDARNAADTEEHVADEAADDGAHDPDQHRNDEPTRVTTRHDGLRDRAGDEPENDPSEDTHVASGG